jgi:DNA helicase HerA-like ATPase
MEICAFGKFAHREKKENRWHTLRMKEEVTYLGRIDYRNDLRVFGIKREDRFAHVYAIGKTGTGKSTLLEGMAIQDLANGNGFALIDPLGDLAERVTSRVPPSRRNDLIYLNAADINHGASVWSTSCATSSWLS